MGRPRKGYEYQGCNEDCLNCPYPDCVKPISEIKTDKQTKEALKKHNSKKIIFMVYQRE